MLYGWNKHAKDARLHLGGDTPDTAMSLTGCAQKL